MVVQLSPRWINTIYHKSNLLLFKLELLKAPLAIESFHFTCSIEFRIVDCVGIMPSENEGLFSYRK